MKRLLTLLFVLVLPLSWALSQTFEGTVRWTMKMDITDPKMKADMEKGQKEMNDPANQAKMKKMQEQMNDPQFKAMMDANPAMKKQMENMMKMQQSGGDMNSMMGKGFTVKIKGTNTLTVMEGGMMDGMEILHQKDADKTVRLDRQNKTYTVMGGGKDNSNGKAPEVKITKTSETAKIIGYNCTKYIAETTVEGKPSTQIFWTTNEIKDFDFKSLARQRMGKGQQPMFYEQIDGVPLKMEMNMPQGNMVMEAAEIKRESLNADLFKIPADFTETKMPGGY
jgi:hypothetical protein